MLTRRDLLLSSAALCLRCTTKSSPLVVRAVSQVVDAVATRDGAGVALRRALGHQALSVVDPFLLLDQFRSDDPNDYLAGFPDHPHRGFETVTYMLEGAMEHRDSVGNHGRLGPGSAQWMTAGHGIVHAEMPKQERGLMWGYQLWVNLPASRKLIPPRYQDVAAARIPQLELDHGHVRVVAGSLLGATGPVTGIDVAPLFVDVLLGPLGELAVPVPASHNVLCLPIDGALEVGDTRREVRDGQLAVLPPGGEVVTLRGPGRGLLLAGRPLGESVARWGPFVMNTREELQQAIDDYRAGRLTLL